MKWFEQLGITKSDLESDKEIVILKFLDEPTTEPVIPLSELKEKPAKKDEGVNKK